MSAEIAFLGEVKVNVANLISSSNTKVDILALIGEISIYEDIFSNTLSGHVFIEDSNDLLSTLPMTGEEYLELDIQTPTLDQKFSKIFYIYKLQNRTSKKRVQTYILNFCSQELIFSSNTKISRAYSGKISSIVDQIWNDRRYMQSNGKFFIEPTSNSYSVVVPYWNTFESINWLANKSMNKNGVPNYLFYESNQAFSFVSVETLMQSEPEREYVFTDSDANTVYGVNGLMDDKYKVVESINTAVSFDYLRNLSAGMYASKLYTMDLTTKNISTNTYDYIRDWDKAKHLNEHPMKTAKLSRRKLANIFFMEKNNYLHGSTKVDQGYSKFFLQRNSLLEQLSSFKISIKVHGRTDIKVGNTIKLVIPELRVILKDEIESSAAQSDYYSGKYLVTAIRHQIINNKHTMHMEIVSDSFVKKVLGS